MALTKAQIDQKNRDMEVALDAAADTVAKQAEKSLAYDFDKAWDEYEDEIGVVYIKLAGEKVKITKQAPARVLLAIMKFERDSGTATDLSRIQKLLNTLFDDRITNKLLQTNVTLMFIMENLIPALFDIWGMGTKDETTGELPQKASGS